MYVPMRRTKEDAEITRQSLLNAAARVFSRDGYAATKLDDIAAAAGVTRGAVAHHFGGKAEIFAALIASKREAIGKTVGMALDVGKTPGERLRGFMVALLIRLEEDEDFRLMNELALFHRGGLPPDAPELPASPDTAYHAGIAELLAAGVASGEIRADLDLQAGAKAVLALVSGVFVNWLTTSDRYSLRREASGIVDAFLSGIIISDR